EGEIADVQLVGEDGKPAHVFFSGERVEIRLKLRAAKPLTDFVVGIGLFNVDGVCAFGTNTNIEDFQAGRLDGEGDVVFAMDSLDLVAGTYKLDVALHKLDGYPYDYHRLLYSFRVKSRTQDAGLYRPKHKWKFAGGVTFTERLRP
ncbi:MAG: Wzt carbohydrate-binding domain-containing protein, partial [Acidobacteriota bacterium]